MHLLWATWAEPDRSCNGATKHCPVSQYLRAAEAETVLLDDIRALGGKHILGAMLAKSNYD